MVQNQWTTKEFEKSSQNYLYDYHLQTQALIFPLKWYLRTIESYRLNLKRLQRFFVWQINSVGAFLMCVFLFRKKLKLMIQENLTWFIWSTGISGLTFFFCLVKPFIWFLFSLLSRKGWKDIDFVSSAYDMSVLYLYLTINNIS